MDREKSEPNASPTGLDLEEFRRARGLSYRQLAALLGTNHASKTRAWAIGEARPEADQAEEIVRRTEGAVTIEAMHRRRLTWLKEIKRGLPATVNNQQAPEVILPPA